MTVQEYRHARSLSKPCFIYIRDRGIERDQALESFLNDEVYDLKQGVTYDYFYGAKPLIEQAANDILAWLVQRHREMTAELIGVRVSKDEINRLRAEIDRLQSASRNPLPIGTATDRLADDLRGWFDTLGYRIEKEIKRTDEVFEWLIDIPTRRGYDRILVRGIQGEAELGDLKSLEESVARERTDEGWLVTLHRISQAVREKAGDQAKLNLFCYTFDELLDENADFSGYLKWLEKEVSKRGIDRMYVPLAAIKNEFDPETGEYLGKSRYDRANGWLDEYINLWLDDPSKEHISVLGEFGTGKTWFSLHYAWTALQRYLEAKERGSARPRLPLVIPLRDYAKAVASNRYSQSFSSASTRFR